MRGATLLLLLALGRSGTALLQPPALRGGVLRPRPPSRSGGAPQQILGRGRNTARPRLQPAAAAPAPLTEFMGSLPWRPDGGDDDPESLRVAFNAVVVSLLLLWCGWSVLNVDAEISRGWTVWEKSARLCAGNWNAYESVLHETPVLTKTAINLGIYLLAGVWCAQGVPAP